MEEMVQNHRNADETAQMNKSLNLVLPICQERWMITIQGERSQGTVEYTSSPHRPVREETNLAYTTQFHSPFQNCFPLQSKQLFGLKSLLKMYGKYLNLMNDTTKVAESQSLLKLSSNVKTAIFLCKTVYKAAEAARQARAGDRKATVLPGLMLKGHTTLVPPTSLCRTDSKQRSPRDLFLYNSWKPAGSSSSCC